MTSRELLGAGAVTQTRSMHGVQVTKGEGGRRPYWGALKNKLFPVDCLSDLLLSTNCLVLFFVFLNSFFHIFLYYYYYFYAEDKKLN